MLPPASQRSAQNRQTVSSLPSLTYAQPNCFFALFVSFFAACSRSVQVHVAVGKATPACLKSFLL